MQNKPQLVEFDASQTISPTKKHDGFFQISCDALTLIYESGGGHREIMAYMVLCSGVNGRETSRISTHGAKSVHLRTGMGYRVAEHAIDWLHKNGFISPVKPDLQQSPQLKINQPRWVISDDSPDVAISRFFLDDYAIKSKPTLYRLGDEIKVTANCGKSQALIDAILLFLRLMQEQDFGEWAGVNPIFWHQTFDRIECDEELPPPVVRIANPDWSLVTIEQKDEGTTCLRFAEKVILNPASEDDLMARFWEALATLKRLRLVYRCLTIWDGDPTNKHVGCKATPLATLYVNDGWARGFEPQAQDEVHRAAWRTGAINSDSETEFEFDRRTGAVTYVGSGRYRYILRDSLMERVCVKGQLRVRHWPSNEENVKSRLRLNRQTTDYVNSLKQI